MISTLPPTPTLPPDSICGYTILRTLGPRSYLASAAGSRKVVLKSLDPDCLLQGQLHPSIKERLARVRELALKGVAHLYGVERDSTGVFLVWEFVEGQPIDQFLEADSARNPLPVFREVALGVDAMHALGIVHGNLHAQNVIVDPTGRVRLTHVSPLLYHEPSVDESAVLSMLRNLTERRKVSTASIGSALKMMSAGPSSLRQLAARLATVAGSETDATVIQAEHDDDRRRRRRTLLSAAATALAGAAIAFSLWALVRSKTPTPTNASAIPAPTPG